MQGPEPPKESSALRSIAFHVTAFATQQQQCGWPPDVVAPERGVPSRGCNGLFPRTSAFRSDYFCDQQRCVPFIDSSAKKTAVSGNPDSAVEAAGVASAAHADKVELARLMSRPALGDQAAFAMLYNATSARVFGLVLRVVRDHCQSEEVTQEAFLEIWRSASRFDVTRGSAVSG